MPAKNEHGLTPQQEAFAQNVARGLSLSDAYRAAYPAAKSWKDDSVHNKASALSRNRQVEARVSVLQAGAADRAEIEGAEILREIRRLAVSDIAGITDEKGRVKLPHELDPATRAAVASFKIDEFGRIEYKFWDKNAALEKAAKILGLYEKDNEQKVDPLKALLQGLSGKVVGATAPGASSDEG